MLQAGWAQDSDHYYMFFNLPDVSEEGVKIEVSSNPKTVKISGENSKHVPFEKTFDLPENASTKNITGGFHGWDNVVYSIKIPKLKPHGAAETPLHVLPVPVPLPVPEPAPAPQEMPQKMVAYTIDTTGDISNVVGQQSSRTEEKLQKTAAESDCEEGCGGLTGKVVGITLTAALALLLAAGVCVYSRSQSSKKTQE